MGSSLSRCFAAIDVGFIADRPTPKPGRPRQKDFRFAGSGCDLYPLDCFVKKTYGIRKAAVRALAKILTTPPLVRAHCCERPQYSTTSAVALPPQSLFTEKEEHMVGSRNAQAEGPVLPGRRRRHPVGTPRTDLRRDPLASSKQPYLDPINAPALPYTALTETLVYRRTRVSAVMGKAVSAVMGKS